MYVFYLSVWIFFFFFTIFHIYIKHFFSKSITDDVEKLANESVETDIKHLYVCLEI